MMNIFKLGSDLSFPPW